MNIDSIATLPRYWHTLSYLKPLQIGAVTRVDGACGLAMMLVLPSLRGGAAMAAGRCMQLQ